MPTITRKKIVGVFVVVVALVFSVFIIVSATFFSTQRRVVIDKEFELKHILDTDKKIEIVFFGYTGCVNICTPRLKYLDKIYKKLPHELQTKVNVVFLDISRPVDSSLPDQFAKAFNENFIGVYLGEKIIRDYTKAFSVYFSKSLFDETEYNHSTNLYIVAKKNNKKSIRYVYNTYPYDVDAIISDIKRLNNE